MPSVSIEEGADGYRDSAVSNKELIKAMLQNQDLTTFGFEFISYPPFNINDFDFLMANIGSLKKLGHLKIKVPYLIAQDSTNYFRGSYDCDRVISNFPINSFQGLDQLKTLHLNFNYSIKFDQTSSA